MCPKWTPNGLTQKRSGCSGSRTVMWPATPSSKPKRREQAEGAREALLAVAALLLDILKSGRPGDVFGSAGSFSHR